MAPLSAPPPTTGLPPDITPVTPDTPRQFWWCIGSFVVLGLLVVSLYIRYVFKMFDPKMQQCENPRKAWALLVFTCGQRRMPMIYPPPLDEEAMMKMFPSPFPEGTSPFQSASSFASASPFAGASRVAHCTRFAGNAPPLPLSGSMSKAAAAFIDESSGSGSGSVRGSSTLSPGTPEAGPSKPKEAVPSSSKLED